MGYRLNVKDLGMPSLEFYGTKLYGYCEESSLSSYAYLKSIGKVTEDTIWNYGFENKIILSADEFVKFIKLYGEDFERETGIDLKTYSDYDELEKITGTNSKKEISWEE